VGYRLYGYESTHVGTGIYTRKLHSHIERISEGVEQSRPPTALKPVALNQILLNRFSIPRGGEVLHLTNQDDLACVGFPSLDGLVVTVHDLFRLTEASRPLDGWRGPKIVENLSEADAVIAISEFTKQQILKYTKVDTEDVHVVYQGVDKSEFYRNMGSGFEDFFLHVGSNLNRKNLEGLFDAFAHIKRQRPEAELVRVGSKDSTCRRKLEEYDLVEGRNVHFLDDVPLSELRQLYTDAEALLFPSKKEGFGRPMIEAAACGTRPIAFNKKPMNEVLPNRLLAEPFEPDKLAQTALQEQTKDPRKISERFSWEETAENTVEVYKEVEKM
jgi:glycosyltransferase involved in cell wall biosynthesis